MLYPSCTHPEGTKPYHSELIEDGTCVLRVGTGVLTGAEILATARALPEVVVDLSKVTHGLVDLTGVTRLDVSTEEIKKISELNLKISQLTGPGRIAIAASSDLAFGMSRMYASMVSTRNWTLATFRTMDEARVWLFPQVKSGS